MSNITSKISTAIIVAGLFIIVSFAALDYDALNINFYIIFSFLFIFVFFFGLATGQRVASPIKKLLEKTEELSKGNLSSRVYLETKDELAGMAKAFNKIAEDLEASRAQEGNAEKSVGIKVKAKTLALEETINALEQKVRNRTSELECMIKSLEKFQGESTIKELEIEKLKQQIKSLEVATEKKKVKKQKPVDDTSNIV